MGIFKKKSHPTAFSRKDISKLLNDDSPFAIKEAYNSIRTKLLFSGKGDKCPVFVMTSALPNDGKTVNLINIAFSFAQLGKNTLLIDADMRNPTVHKYFNTSSKNGLSEVLANLTDSNNIKRSSCKNLFVMTAGEIPPNPAELLGSAQMDKLLEYAREHFDYVFIDAPPVEVVTDASMLASKVTGFIFLVRLGRNDLNIVRHAIASLEQLDAVIAGFVLNDVEGKSDNYYKNYKSNKHYGKYKYYRSFKYGAKYSYGYPEKKDD